MAKKAAKKTVKKVAKAAKTPSKKTATKKPAAKTAKATVKKTSIKKAVKKTAAKPKGLTIKKVSKKASRPIITAKPKATPKVPAAKRLTKSPLTETQLKAFKQLLLNKRQDLVGDMNGIHAESLNSSGGLSSMPTHPADIGSDNFEQEFTLGLLESERLLLTDINDALERVVGGTYGICLGTGEAINLPRLKARPWAKYGIEYARLIEQGLVTPDEDDDAE